MGTKPAATVEEVEREVDKVESPESALTIQMSERMWKIMGRAYDANGKSILIEAMEEEMAPDNGPIIDDISRLREAGWLFTDAKRLRITDAGIMGCERRKRDLDRKAVGQRPTPAKPSGVGGKSTQKSTARPRHGGMAKGTT